MTQIDDPSVLARPVQTDGPTPTSKMYEEMKEAGSDSMTFHITRDAEPNTTFSKEGLDDVFTSIDTFIVARIAARMGDPALPGPSDMHVDVSVTLDNKRFRVPSDTARPWYALDGRTRLSDEDRAKDVVAEALDKLPGESRVRVLEMLRADLEAEHTELTKQRDELTEQLEGGER